ncbi:MAG: amino acid permease [Caldilineaceae bacterium]|nr:amino acid permease [Caldilineaceae bacterium]
MSVVKTELSRDLSLFDITMIGVGAMIGAGIFVLTGIAAGVAGPALILAFALNGIIAIITAITYAELGSAIPEAGGGYLWVREGLPGPNAFLAGWMSWFAHAVAGSLYALGFGSYMALVFDELGLSFGLPHEILHKGLAAVIILIFMAINFRGVSETGKAGNIVTVLKVVILGIFIISGLWAIFRSPIYLDKFDDFAPAGLLGIVRAMGLTFIAFEGYEIIVQAGEEVKNPRETIPKAVFLSLAIVVPIYMLVAFVTIGAVNPDTDIPTYQWLAQHAELGVAEAARQFMPLGTLLLLVGGILSTMSALNATTFSSTRVSFAMGRDRNLPAAFAQINSLTRTPHKALLFSGALILAMAVFVPIEDVAAAADVMFLLLFLQVNVTVITIRNKYGKRLRYGYLMPFFPYIPVVGIITQLLLALFLFGYSPTAWYLALLWIGFGLLIFYLYSRPRVNSRERTPVILEERRVTATPRDYQVLVPIANPASLPNLLWPAINAARREEGRILLLHVVTVPEQTPLSAGREYIQQSRPLIEEALRITEAKDVPAEVIVRISHRPADAIVQTALERGVNLLIMGWRGQSKTGTAFIGRNIDRIVEAVNCEVLVIQQLQVPPFQRILVPVADPLQTSKAVNMARLLIRDGEGAIDVLHIFRPATPPHQRQQLIEAVELQLAGLRADNPDLRDGQLALKTIESPDVVNAIVDATTGYDCVVLGTSRDSWLKQQLLGSKPTQIAQRVTPPVVLASPSTSPVGFSWFRLLNYVRGGYKRIEPASERELVEHGLLAPEEQEVTEPPLHSRVNQNGVLVTALVSLASVVAMYIGHGETLTWVAGVLFLAALIWFTRLSMAGTGPGAHQAGERPQGGEAGH